MLFYNKKVHHLKIERKKKASKKLQKHDAYCFLKNKCFVDCTHKYIVTSMEKNFT